MDKEDEICDDTYQRRLFPHPMAIPEMPRALPRHHSSLPQSNKSCVGSIPAQRHCYESLQSTLRQYTLRAIVPHRTYHHSLRNVRLYINNRSKIRQDFDKWRILFRHAAQERHKAHGSFRAFNFEAVFETDREPVKRPDDSALLSFAI